MSRIGVVDALNTPFRIKARAIIEGFLSSNACGRKTSVEIGAPHCLSFWHSFPEEYGEAPDECVAGTGAVDTLYRKGRHVLAYPGAGEERSVGSKGNDDAANAAGHQFLRALLRVLDVPHSKAGDGFGLALVGNEVIEVRQRSHFDGLPGRRV